MQGYKLDMKRYENINNMFGHNLLRKFILQISKLWSFEDVVVHLL